MKYSADQLPGWLLGEVLAPDHLCSTRGENVRVAVIDTGIDSSQHPTIASQVMEACVLRQEPGTNRCRREIFSKAKGNLETAWGSVIQGHGTAVAGVIQSVAESVRFVDVNILDVTGGQPGSLIRPMLRGLEWAIRHDDHIHIINLSFVVKVFERDRRWAIPYLFQLCEEAYERGITIVAARSNDTDVMTGFGIPAKFSNIISVGVEPTFSGDPLQLRFLQNSLVEFAAWGYQVPTASFFGGGVRVNGTSFASAHVSGMCALLLSRYPDLQPYEVKALLARFANR